MAQKKKPVFTLKTTHTKKKQPLAIEIELQQRQESLELINKRLAQSQVELEAAYRQYTDLYDFAPVGYLTLSQDGTIHKVNLAGANLLGVSHNELIQLRLAAFVSSKSRPTFHAFFEKLLSGVGKETCELEMEQKGKGPFWVRLEATCFEGGEVCRAMLADISEHKRMEQALQESEHRFRMLLQDVPTIAVQGYAIDGTIQYWNTASERLYGYSAQEALGRSLLGLIIPPEMRSEVWHAIQQMGETGHPIPASELSLMRKGGSRVPVYSSHAIVSVPGCEPELFCLDVDLTERKQAEKLLQESEWRTRIVSELTTDYIFVVDVDPDGILKLRWASDNMFRMTGRMVQDAATSDLWKNIIHPDDIVRFFDFINRILSTAEAGEFECRTFYKDGRERWVWIFARPQVNEKNRVTTIVGAIQDITERKQAEEALRENQELFSLFMLHSPIYAFIKEVTPTKSRVLQASDNYQEMIGISGGDMVGKTMEELFPAEVAAKFTADDWSVVASGKVLKLDEDLNGRHYTTIKFPIILGDKTLLAGYTIDITERKQAEMELQYMKEGLEAANRELQTALAFQQQLAHTDALTGINNRRHLYELAEHEFEVAARYQQPLSVIMFDIDHFKQVNDTFGHSIGDQILQRVTQVACAKLRSADVVGRYGGEEFVVFLPMTNAKQAYPLAERIRVGVAAIRVPTEKGDAAVTLSIGIAEMKHSAPNESAEDMIRRADEAMYDAKQAGRNRTEIGDL